MSIMFFENDQRPYMYDTEGRILWLLDGNTCMQIDDPVMAARIRTVWNEISHKKALELAGSHVVA